MIRKSVMPEKSELRDIYVLAADNYIKALEIEIKKNKFLYSIDIKDRIEELRDRIKTYPEDGLWILFKQLVNLI